MSIDPELAAERSHVAFLYNKLDAERVAAQRELDAALCASTLDAEARWQREVSVAGLATRVRGLATADHGLCFGRLDGHAGPPSYIGRIGLFDGSADYEPLLLDWRAPAARPFYTATAAQPEGIVRRRHFRSSGRTVVALHDDVFVGGVAGSGDEALLAALNAPRDTHMRDIVATIQAEQDEIIRLRAAGIVVVEGGPGTGKTAVALHRVAYLMYTLRERLSRWGVLVIGPNPGFLDYVGDVLPSLGETDVVFATPGELCPGLSVSAEDEPEARRVKGSLAMVDVLAAAVADRQELPASPIPVQLEDVTVEVDARVAAVARQRARAAELPHNDARPVFRDALVTGLTTRAVDMIGSGWLDADDTAIRAGLAADVRLELAASQQVWDAVDQLWPLLTPQRLLAELYTSPARIAAAAPALEQRSVLYREIGDAWTVSDVPLLDEAVEFIGTDRSAERRAEAELRERVEYAEGVLQVLDTDEDPDGETLRAVDVVDASVLSDRYASRDNRTIAERASADRDWTYGHVVVDEAQELSEMDWRVIMRRCPNRSMTIVGDLAQRQSPAGARAWGDMLDRYAPGRWTYRQLTVNYRTPAEIMAVAARVLAAVDPNLTPPESVRGTGHPPAAHLVDDLAAGVADVLRDRPAGTVAVIVPEDVELDIPTLTPRQAKGLEFDTVVLAEPARMRDPAELYVALTRATQRLHVVHTEPLPDALVIPAAAAPSAVAAMRPSPATS